MNNKKNNIDIDVVKHIIQHWTWEQDCEQQYIDMLDGIICYLLPDNDLAAAEMLRQSWINTARADKYEV